MINIKNNAKKGFTIIEVVLVLAIAGLIFLMVFVAFPALQRNQKDSQRRQDYAMLSSAVSSYMANNNNSLKNLTGDKIRKNITDWINKTGQDPDGNTYNVDVLAWDSKYTNEDTAPKLQKTENNETKYYVYVVKNARCDGGVLKNDGSSRAFAIYGYMESGDHIYCSDSQ